MSLPTIHYLYIFYLLQYHVLQKSFVFITFPWKINIIKVILVPSFFSRLFCIFLNISPSLYSGVFSLDSFCEKYYDLIGGNNENSPKNSSDQTTGDFLLNEVSWAWYYKENIVDGDNFSNVQMYYTSCMSYILGFVSQNEFIRIFYQHVNLCSKSM